MRLCNIARLLEVSDSTLNRLWWHPTKEEKKKNLRQQGRQLFPEHYHLSSLLLKILPAPFLLLLLHSLFRCASGRVGVQRNISMKRQCKASLWGSGPRRPSSSQSLQHKKESYKPARALYFAVIFSSSSEVATKLHFLIFLTLQLSYHHHHRGNLWGNLVPQ